MSVPPRGARRPPFWPRDVLLAVNGEASPHRRKPDPSSSRFQDHLSRRRRGGYRPSTGSVLWHRHVYSHPQASHRRAVSRRGSLPNGRASRHIHRRGSHLVGGNPSPGLPAHRKHGWSAVHTPRRPTGWGVAEPVVSCTNGRVLSVWISARPPTAVASRSVRDSRPPFGLRPQDGILSLLEDSDYCESFRDRPRDCVRSTR
jgi:hypothetical protein